MATTKADIKQWLKEGKAEGASHMIVVCDTFSWEDYPVYVQPDENFEKKLAEYKGKEMQKVMEVYRL